jgi:mannose-6-phosphate isomerase-like protein (cupin superfamily)/DNA-binding XRE family transcriptional regulator
MQEKIKELASRVQELRDLSDLSQGQMADYLGIALRTYQAYELGEEDIPASILYAISHKLGVDMTTLLTGDEPKMHVFTVTRAGKGVKVERRKQYGYENLVENFAHKKGEFFIVTVPPTQDAPEPNVHHGQEFNYVLEGTLKVIIHHNELVLNKGDAIYFDAGYEHAMVALGGTPATFLAVIL